jgi:three-Cys-motif partner protein
MSSDFFNEMTGQSEVKIEIVRKYFWAWAKIIIPSVRSRPNPRIGYVDLFAGPGRYGDGSDSTPILILQRAISEPEMARMLVARLNDADPQNAAALEASIRNLPGIDRLKFYPKVGNFEVDDSLIARLDLWDIPTLFYLDPWGYKGLSLPLIKAVLRTWGSDCFFFFNYNRINLALSNPVFTTNMNAVFSKPVADGLRARLAGLTPARRQDAIIEALKEALKNIGGTYTREFCFKDAHGTRTSHFLIGVSKNIKGYDLMKSIMAGESKSDQGVPLFEYGPVESTDTPYLPGLGIGLLDNLKAMLLAEFAGRTMRMLEVYTEHHVGRDYVRSNYKEALRQLEAEGSITAVPAARDRRRTGAGVTFGDDVLVSFPIKPP